MICVRPREQSSRLPGAQIGDLISYQNNGKGRTAIVGKAQERE
jgi:hypothetical protein